MVSKRQHKGNNLKLKYEALLDLEIEKTNKDISKSLNVPRNTLPTWKKKNKAKCLKFFIKEI